MEKNNVTITLVFFICAVGIFKVDETQAESSEFRFSSEPSRSFNPFSMNSWLNLPSQFVQYWFPLFRPAYYPSYLQKPTTVKPTTVTPTTGSQHQTTESSKTNNIFGISESEDESVEYLPKPSEIECHAIPPPIKDTGKLKLLPEFVTASKIGFV